MAVIYIHDRRFNRWDGRRATPYLMAGPWWNHISKATKAFRGCCDNLVCLIQLLGVYHFQVSNHHYHVYINVRLDREAIDKHLFCFIERSTVFFSSEPNRFPTRKWIVMETKERPNNFTVHMRQQNHTCPITPDHLTKYPNSKPL